MTTKVNDSQVQKVEKRVVTLELWDNGESVSYIAHGNFQYASAFKRNCPRSELEKAIKVMADWIKPK